MINYINSLYVLFTKGRHNCSTYQWYTSTNCKRMFMMNYKRMNYILFHRHDLWCLYFTLRSCALLTAGNAGRRKILKFHFTSYWNRPVLKYRGFSLKVNLSFTKVNTSSNKICQEAGSILQIFNTQSLGSIGWLV